MEAAAVLTGRGADSTAPVASESAEPPRGAVIGPEHDQGAREQGRQARPTGQTARAASRQQRFVVNDVVLLVLLVSSILVLTFVILSNQQGSAPSEAVSGSSAEFKSMQPEILPGPAPDQAQDEPTEAGPDPDEAAQEDATEAATKEKQEHDLEPEAEVGDARLELEAEIQAEWEMLKAEQRRAEPETAKQEQLPAEPVE